MQNHSTDGAEKVKAKSNISFIHSSLDDHPLTLEQFRVYCHVNRVAGEEGVCWESITTISKHCGMHHQTARKCLHFLAKEKLLAAEPRDGETTHYRLTKPEQWKEKPPLRRERRGKAGTKGRATTPAKGDPYDGNVGKGIPEEGIPKKGGPKVAGADDPELKKWIDSLDKLYDRELEEIEKALMKALVDSQDPEEWPHYIKRRNIVRRLRKERKLGPPVDGKPHSVSARPKTTGRSKGTLNDGNSSMYRDVGKVLTPEEILEGARFAVASGKPHLLTQSQREALAQAGEPVA